MNSPSLVSASVSDAPMSMSSREIAELTGKEHKHVLRDARTMLSELGLTDRGYAQNWTDPQNGQIYPMLALPRDLTLTLVAGYSVSMRHRIVMRWQELEDRARNPIAGLSRIDLLKLALEAEEKRLALESQVAQLAPKAEFADAVMASEDTLSIADAAKAIGVPERRLRAELKARGLVLANNAPAAKGVDQGYFKVETYTFKLPDGPRFGVAARVTGRGLQFIRSMAVAIGLVDPIAGKRQSDLYDRGTGGANV